MTKALTTKAPTTRQKLLVAARQLFWTRGYSNVSVRDITGAAGVDAALVSRYFGGKQGLFEATLAEVAPWEALAADRDGLLAAAVASFTHPVDEQSETATAFSMLLSNVIDPEMGPRIQDMVQNGMADPLAETIGGPRAAERAAMLLAVLFGLALMRKNFRLGALKDMPLEELRQLTTHLAEAALVDRG